MKGSYAGAQLLLLRVMILILFALLTPVAQAATGEGRASVSNAETLMLVRRWDPAIGELIGWLPTHHAALFLEFIDKPSGSPKFSPNEAVTLVWAPRPDSPPNEILTSPPTRVIEGQRYVPVERTGNIVRIGKFHFFLQKITLGDSKWKRASELKVDGKAQEK